MDWFIVERAEPKVPCYIDLRLLDIHADRSFEEPWSFDRKAFREVVRQCIDVASPDNLGIFLIDGRRQLLSLMLLNRVEGETAKELLAVRPCAPRHSFLGGFLNNSSVYCDRPMRNLRKQEADESANSARRDSNSVELRGDVLGHEPEGTTVRWDHPIDL
jgi:hypothetical protein